MEFYYAHSQKSILKVNNIREGLLSSASVVCLGRPKFIIQMQSMARKVVDLLQCVIKQIAFTLFIRPVSVLCRFHLPLGPASTAPFLLLVRRNRTRGGNQTVAVRQVGSYQVRETEREIHAKICRDSSTGSTHQER